MPHSNQPGYPTLVCGRLTPDYTSEAVGTGGDEGFGRETGGWGGGGGIPVSGPLSDRWSQVFMDVLFYVVLICFVALCLVWLFL